MPLSSDRSKCKRGAFFSDLDFLTQVCFRHLDPDRIAFGQVWQNPGAHSTGVFSDSAIQGNIVEVAVAHRRRIGRLTRPIPITEIKWVGHSALSKRRMEIVGKKRVI